MKLNRKDFIAGLALGTLAGPSLFAAGDDGAFDENLALRLMCPVANGGRL